jgi:hypothetical protein
MGILRGALSEEEQAILQLCDEYENQKTDDKMVQQARTQKTNLMKRLNRWYQTQGTEIWPPSNILNSARDLTPSKQQSSTKCRRLGRDFFLF